MKFCFFRSDCVCGFRDFSGPFGVLILATRVIFLRVHREILILRSSNVLRSPGTYSQEKFLAMHTVPFYSCSREF